MATSVFNLLFTREGKRKRCRKNGSIWKPHACLPQGQREIMQHQLLLIFIVISLLMHVRLLRFLLIWPFFDISPIFSLYVCLGRPLPTPPLYLPRIFILSFLFKKDDIIFKALHLLSFYAKQHITIYCNQLTVYVPTVLLRLLKQRQVPSKNNLNFISTCRHFPYKVAHNRLHLPIICFYSRIVNFRVPPIGFVHPQF